MMTCSSSQLMDSSWHQLLRKIKLLKWFMNYARPGKVHCVKSHRKSLMNVAPTFIAKTTWLSWSSTWRSITTSISISRYYHQSVILSHMVKGWTIIIMEVVTVTYAGIILKYVTSQILNTQTNSVSVETRTCKCNPSDRCRCNVGSYNPHKWNKCIVGVHNLLVSKHNRS